MNSVCVSFGVSYRPHSLRMNETCIFIPILRGLEHGNVPADDDLFCFAQPFTRNLAPQ